MYTFKMHEKRLTSGGTHPIHYCEDIEFWTQGCRSDERVWMHPWSGLGVVVDVVDIVFTEHKNM